VQSATKDSASKNRLLPEAFLPISAIRFDIGIEGDNPADLERDESGVLSHRSFSSIPALSSEKIR
jgi:hypothetical protein